MKLFVSKGSGAPSKVRRNTNATELDRHLPALGPRGKTYALALCSELTRCGRARYPSNSAVWLPEYRHGSCHFIAEPLP